MTLETDPTGAPYPGAPVTYAEAVAAGVPLRRSRWGLADVAIALLLSVIAPVVGLSVLAALGSGVGTPAFSIGAFVLPWIGFGLWPILTTRLQGNGPGIDLGFRFRLSDLGWGVLGGAASVALGFAAALLTQLIHGPFDSAAGSTLTDEGLPVWTRATLTVVAVTLAPLFEELCFRGLAFAAIARSSARRGWRAVPVATIGSAVLFALVHFEPVRIGVLLVIGLVLSVVRARTGRVGASVVAHSVNNLVSVLFTL